MAFNRAKVQTVAKPLTSRSRPSLQLTLSYLALIAFAIFSIYPITQMITIALRLSDQLLSTSLALIPNGATFQNFRILLTHTSFLRWVFNSTLIALAVTLTGVALASASGYALSRFRPELRRSERVAATGVWE